MTQALPNSRPDARFPGARLYALSWRFIGCVPGYAAALLISQLWLGLLWFFYQGHGIARGVIVGCYLAGLILLRYFPRASSTRQAAGAAAITPLLKVLLVATVVVDLVIVISSSVISLETSKIPMDEGQTSWRAARLLWQGQDPYASRALVDLGAYRSRSRERQNAEFRPLLAQGDVTAELQRYDRSLDPQIRDKLVPFQKNAKARREARLYGYKYGPLILLATAAIAPFGLPGGVLIMNGMVCFALFAVMWAILRDISAPQIALAGAAMLALLLDRHITRNYMDRSATDVWALLFGALAVLAVMSRRPGLAGVAAALAVGCKMMPGLLFVPLLLRCRPRVSLGVFLVVATAIYVPWCLWDTRGLLFNVVLWPLYMVTDFTSWQFYAPHWAAIVARATILVALALLWLRYVFSQHERLFWTLAVSGTLVLLASGFLRNGYVPWVSLWAVAAIAEAFSASFNATGSAERDALAPNERTFAIGRSATVT
jgi:hypothetical protein